MKTFFISDTHFYHDNIIEFEGRPFKNIEDMNNSIIRNWQNKVSPEDQVFIVGDFSFGTRDQTISILNKLPGNKFLIKGNHDLKMKTMVKSKFGWVKDYHELNLNGEIIVLCHYPFTFWNKSHYGSLNIYGHVHSMKHRDVIWRPRANQYNVGVDVIGFEPCELWEIKEKNKIWREKL